VNLAHYQEEVDFANSYNRADRFAGFDRGASPGAADMNATKNEAIANADAHTTNVGLPSYSDLLELLVKVANYGSRPIGVDSTGQPMVQFRAALIDQVRETVSRAK
jgi:hydroxyethylthiazole kinase-like sugar kinase family protein